MKLRVLIKEIKEQSKKYPWDFMLFIFLALLIPRIYSIMNTYWIGHIDYSSLAIAEQYEFMGILIEIVNETIPFGILALVSQSYKDRNSVVRQFVAGITLQLILSTTLAVIILANMSSFVDFIGTSPELAAQTVSYLSLRAIALPFASLSLLLVVGLKSMDRAKLALGIVVVNVAVNMVLDIFLVSPYPFSLHLGLEGVAIGYLISNVLYCGLALIASVVTLKMRLSEWGLQSILHESRPLFGVGGWTGIDSFVRNFFYFFVLQVLNFMGPNQYAGFQLFQRIMWTALIPVIAISQGTSIRVGNYLNEKNRESKIHSLITVSVILALLIIGGFGIIGIFAIDAMGYFFTSNAEIVHYSTVMFWWQIIPYILFAVSMNLKSVFYGTGKTYNILIISIILNLCIIVPFFYMMNALILPRAFESVMMMFVLVDIIDIIITYILVRHVMTKEIVSNR
ncbi:MAG: polysaccharide biosynthesis C-terminal domain-containing protein [Candidatus Thorarchaeota archaeon]|nr:polysaccharide biosynthesis C-terminal domain-containing protein [Candidatus Thorarchaeota archaeon]